MLIKSTRRHLNVGEQFQNPGNTQDESFVNFLRGNGYERFSYIVMWSLYRDVSPLTDAVDHISSSLKEIPIILSNENEVKRKHKALDKLKNPSINQGYRKFSEALSIDCSVTNDFAYIMTSVNNENREPLEIYPAEVRFLEINESTNSMFPDSILYNCSTKPQQVFYKDEIGDRLRYISKDGNELVYDAGFSSGGEFRGDSSSSSVWSELEQYRESNINNLSLMKRGARPSFIASIKNASAGDLAALKEIQRELSKFQSSHNAGSIPVVPDADIKSIQANNRDMQFLENKDHIERVIAKRFKIPLQFITDRTSTYNNVGESKKMIYTEATFPQLNRILESFDRYILPRFKDTEGFEFSYSENEIPAMRESILEEGKLMTEIGVNSKNEIRAVLGDEELASGGTQILDRSSKIVGDTDNVIDISVDDADSLTR